MMGDAGASSTTGLAARPGLGDRCGCESAACRLSVTGDKRNKEVEPHLDAAKASEAATVTVSRTLTVCFQPHRHVGAIPQAILLCAKESLPAQGVVASECWLDFSFRCMYCQGKKFNFGSKMTVTMCVQCN